MKWRFIFVSVIFIAGSFFLHSFSEINDAYEFNRFWIEKTHGVGAQKFDVLICGDSRVYRGVSSRVIAEKLTDYSVFNLSYSSGSYSDFMLDYIEKHLNKGAKQPILILGITPYSLTAKAAMDEHIRTELGRKKEEILEYRYFKSVKNHFEALNLNTIMFKTREAPAAKYYQKYNYDEGWVASYKNPADPKAALTEYTRDFLNNKVSHELTTGLLHRISKWTDKGFRVYGFRPPSTTEMVALETKLSGFNESDFVKEFERSGGKWINLDTKEYRSYDGSHLDENSAIKLSNTLGVFLQRETGN